MIQEERVSRRKASADHQRGGEGMHGRVDERRGDTRLADTRLADERKSGRKNDSYVLYWMQRSQREGCNHALEYAVERANELDLPVLVLFVLVPDYPEATDRHYRFMLEGLEVTASRLRERGVGFVLERGASAGGHDMRGAAVEEPPSAGGHNPPAAGGPVETVLSYAAKAALLVGDRSYLRIGRSWRSSIAGRVRCPYHEVETDLIVPVETASPKEEYSAGTLRPKIHRNLFRFLEPLARRSPKVPWEGARAGGFGGGADSAGGNAAKTRHGGEREPELPRGGEDAAEELLEDFVQRKLGSFDELRNDPARDFTSGLSPYLHFGQISPLTIALAALEREDLPTEGFLEELVVRRELAFNFTWYDPLYDSVECLPRWARETLEVHEEDRRDPSYSLEELEGAETDDPYWNAAQRELLVSAKMHGYMRMYWGKKILEWSPSVEEAFARALYLNNRYALDGRDPNSYAGIAWCFGKHDRAWTERKIFGKVRYMNDRGLRRKFKIDRYVERIEQLGW